MRDRHTNKCQVARDCRLEGIVKITECLALLVEEADRLDDSLVGVDPGDKIGDLKIGLRRLSETRADVVPTPIIPGLCSCPTTGLDTYADVGVCSRICHSASMCLCRGWAVARPASGARAVTVRVDRQSQTTDSRGAGSGRLPESLRRGRPQSSSRTRGPCVRVRRASARKHGVEKNASRGHKHPLYGVETLSLTRPGGSSNELQYTRLRRRENTIMLDETEHVKMTGTPGEDNAGRNTSVTVV